MTVTSYVIANLAQRIQFHTPRERKRGFFRKETRFECDCGWQGDSQREAHYHTARAILTGRDTPIQLKPEWRTK